MRLRAFLLFVSALLWVSAALAQSNPSNPPMSYGPPAPTVGQWNSWFAQKQDVLGFTPLSTAGGSLSGRLNLFASSAAQAGVNLGVGSAPTSPTNGDLWLTSSGIFARVNGSTVSLNGTSIPVTGITGLGTGVATLLSGNATGTGGPVGSTNPVIAGATLSSATLTGPTISSPTVSGGILTSPTLVTPLMNQISATTPIVHQSQGGQVAMIGQLPFIADYLKISDADLSQTTTINTLGTFVTGDTAAVNWTVGATTYHPPAYTVHATPATFTGIISGTTMTVSSGLSGTIFIGQQVTGSPISTAPNTFILSGSGTSWQVSQSQTVASTTLTTSDSLGSIVFGVCEAISNDSSLVSALLSYHPIPPDQYGNGYGYAPTQDGCINQAFFNSNTGQGQYDFDQPYGGGGVTTTVVTSGSLQAVVSNPLVDGGPFFILQRNFPNTYTAQAGDQMGILDWYWSGAIGTNYQTAFIQPVWNSFNSVTMNIGVTADGTTKTGMALCGLSTGNVGLAVNGALCENVFQALAGINIGVRGISDGSAFSWDFMNTAQNAFIPGELRGSTLEFGVGTIGTTSLTLTPSLATFTTNAVFNSAVGFYGATPPTQPTGYGTPTSVSLTANFPGTGATLAQTGGTLAALITNLKATGIIGN